jgi:hypothetical protein
MNCTEMALDHFLFFSFSRFTVFLPYEVFSVSV